MPTRDELIESHLDLVDKIARKYVSRSPQHVDLEDVRSAGYLGLVQAADGFRPDLGVPFGAYARTRVYGAIIDWARQVDMLPRKARDEAQRGEREHFVDQLAPSAIEADPDDAYPGIAYRCGQVDVPAASVLKTIQALTVESNHERTHDQDEQIAAILWASRTLPLEARRVVFLHGVLGVSAQRLARGRHRSHKTLLKRFKVALQSIRVELGQEHGERLIPRYRPNPPLKMCGRCREMKPHEAFTRNKKHGRPQSWCRACTNAWRRARHALGATWGQRAENQERMREIARRSARRRRAEGKTWEQQPENKARRAELQRIYRARKKAAAQSS